MSSYKLVLGWVPVTTLETRRRRERTPAAERIDIEKGDVIWNTVSIEFSEYKENKSTKFTTPRRSKRLEPCPLMLHKAVLFSDHTVVRNYEIAGPSYRMPEPWNERTVGYRTHGGKMFPPHPLPLENTAYHIPAGALSVPMTLDEVNETLENLHMSLGQFVKVLENIFPDESLSSTTAILDREIREFKTRYMRHTSSSSGLGIGNSRWMFEDKLLIDQDSPRRVLFNLHMDIEGQTVVTTFEFIWESFMQAESQAVFIVSMGQQILAVLEKDLQEKGLLKAPSSYESTMAMEKSLNDLSLEKSLNDLSREYMKNTIEPTKFIWEKPK